MKKNFFLILITLFTFSCDENTLTVDPTVLTGTWRVVDVLVDPGDGSGTFMSIDSDKTMRFFESGTVRTNSEFCDFSQDINLFLETTYSSSDSIIYVECDDFEWDMPFELRDENLILYYLCDEPCVERYVKVSN